jgi:hypothetical protein
VAGIVERRHTLPILANVLLRKNGGMVEFTTSDLEIQVRTSAELGGDAGSFSTTVGARKLIDILRSAAGRPGGDARRRRTSSRCRAARAASRCRRCRPTTSRWSTRRWTSAPPSACRRRR